MSMYDFNKYVIIDVEADHNHGLDPWHPEFKLLSLASVVVNKYEGTRSDYYFTDKEEIIAHLSPLIEDGYVIAVYNASYEHPVILSQLNIDINKKDLLVDVMRMYQYSTKRTGQERSLKLESAFEEFFDIADYKSEYTTYLVQNNVARNPKEAHKKVGMLPPDMLGKYNLKDVYVTEEVMYACMGYLGSIGYDWDMDHNVYIHDVCRNTRSYLRGLKMNFEKALQNLQKIKDKQDKIKEEIFETYKDGIDLFMKTYPKKVTSFNIGSTTQLAFFCTDILGLKCEYFTEKGKPSFAKGFLGQWGEFGLLVKEHNKLNGPYRELKKTISLASITGRLHSQVKAGLTSTGRSKSCKDIK